MAYRIFGLEGFRESACIFSREPQRTQKRGSPSSESRLHLYAQSIAQFISLKTYFFSITIVLMYLANLVSLHTTGIFEEN